MMTNIEFDIAGTSDEVYIDMLRWLHTLGNNMWSLIKSSSGRITGISFTYKDDAIAFKLKFGL